MKITHYAVRDLRKYAPDDYPDATYDVVAKMDTGEVFYCEELFTTEDGARLFIAGQQLRSYGVDYWEGNLAGDLPELVWEKA